MTDSEKLLKIKKTIENAKSEISKLEGKQEQLYESFEKDFDCQSIEDAEAKLVKMENKLDDDEKTLKDGLFELETKFTW